LKPGLGWIFDGAKSYIEYIDIKLFENMRIMWQEKKKSQFESVDLCRK